MWAHSSNDPVESTPANLDGSAKQEKEAVPMKMNGSGEHAIMWRSSINIGRNGDKMKLIKNDLKRAKRSGLYLLMNREGGL